MNWKSIARRYPLATQAYNGYVANIGVTRAYNKFIRPGVTMADLPWELQHGVVSAFLEHQGCLIEPVLNSGGFAAMRLYDRRNNGRFLVFHRLNNDSNPVQTYILYQQAVLCCLKRIEEKARKALEPTPEVEEVEGDFIGVDISSLGGGDEQ